MWWKILFMFCRVLIGWRISWIFGFLMMVDGKCFVSLLKMLGCIILFVLVMNMLRLVILIMCWNMLKGSLFWFLIVIMCWCVCFCRWLWVGFWKRKSWWWCRFCIIFFCLIFLSVILVVFVKCWMKGCYFMVWCRMGMICGMLFFFVVFVLLFVVVCWMKLVG